MLRRDKVEHKGWNIKDDFKFFEYIDLMIELK